MRSISLARLAIGALAIALTACDSSTDPSERALPIVYAFYPENDVTQGDLYLASEDGRTTRQLTSLAGVENSPAWSPDGERIAFLRIVYPENLLDPDTNAVYVVTPTAPTRGGWRTGRGASSSPPGRRTGGGWPSPT